MTLRDKVAKELYRWRYGKVLAYYIEGMKKCRHEAGRVLALVKEATPCPK
jgi:hypothetical protein